MRTPYINSFIKKAYDAKNGGVKEFKVSVFDAEGIVMELSQIITDNHLISTDDLKEILKNTRNSSNSESSTLRISGGTF